MTAPATKLPQYDAIRQRLKSQFTQARQDQGDAIKRRFAANGMVGSGAFGKAQDEAAQKVGKDEADATAALDFQEAGELQRRQEVAEGRQYQTSEREASQGFQKGMFDTQFGEQKRQFDQEFGENQKTNKLSFFANIMADDPNDLERLQGAEKLWSNQMGGGAAPTDTAQKLQAQRAANQKSVNYAHAQMTGQWNNLALPWR
jgi:hypothetical protein